MLHLVGQENFIEGTHHPDISDDKELIQYYLNVIKLFYATPEADKWIASKLREDIPIIVKYSSISRTEAILWWCNAQWKLINKTHKDRYVKQEEWVDEKGKCERYLVWLEEKK